MKILKKTIKKILSCLWLLLFVPLGAYLLCMLLHLKPYIVLSGSMEPAVPAGSVCFLDTGVLYEEVQVGDIVGFQKGEHIMAAHRATRITEEGIETQGDANEYSDGISVTEENYLGIIRARIPKLGTILSVLQKGRGRILVVLAGILLLLLSACFSEERKNYE